MRALKMAGGMLLMVLSVLSVFPMVEFKMPHPFLICALGFAAGALIFWYYKNQKRGNSGSE
ncbi:MAG: hypothetical protein AAB549_00225 [Patescibacteria group bacterium]